ncbi:MAG: hypothetical protein FJ215_08710 [Ignavibacteria bacterium]|nr:hypothetical protein [Ignavibacteria bacterium]
MERRQVDILGLSTTPSAGGAYALILKETDGQRRLPIIIGQFEAHSIALEMEGIKPPRPLTHDLLKSIIDSLGGDVRDVCINDLREGTFYARINIDSQEIDSRPSDAIALAVRFGVPIFVAEEVLEEAGFLPEGNETEADATTPKTPSDTKTTLKTPLSKLDELQKQLKEAVEKEEYEKAAGLRDAIKKYLSHDS